MLKSFVAVLLIVKACLSVVESSRQSGLLIYPSQNHIIAPVKERLTLECGCKFCEDEDFNLMTWLNENGEEITGNVVRTELMIKLIFPAPELKDGGTYKCGFLEKHPRLEAKVIVDFYVPITFEECPEVQNLIFGKTGHIKCRTAANPMPKVIWKKDGSIINSEQITVDEFVLTIPSVGEEDMGTYSVEAFVRETGKSLVQNIHVNVITPPKINDLPEEFTVIQGENNTIKCGATGSEPLTYKWYNKFHRDVTHRLYSYGHKVEQGILTISKVTRIVGEFYICEVSNPAGKDEATVKIKIQRSEICDKSCGDDAQINLLPLSNEDLKKTCTVFVENMRCKIQDREICIGADVTLDDTLRNQYEFLAVTQETYCSEKTLFHAVLLDNMECFRKIATFTDSSNFTIQCNSDDQTKMERRVEKMIESLGEKGLILFADYDNINEQLHFCIELVYIIACHGLNIEDLCGTVAMYVYADIIQKIEPLNFRVCRESFHLIPAVIRLLKIEVEKERILADDYSLKTFL